MKRVKKLWTPFQPFKSPNPGACLHVQAVPSVLQALEQGAALVHTPPDVFLALVDKSIPTACGLAGVHSCVLATQPGCPGVKGVQTPASSQVL